MVKGKSSGIAIGIIGLIVGAAGLGIGGYAFITFRAEIDDLIGQIEDLEEDMGEKSSVQKTWYVESLDPHFPTADSIFEAITSLSITFNVRENEAVYLLYTGTAYILKTTGFSCMKMYFRIDGEIKSKPHTMAGGLSLYASDTYIPVVLQHSNNTLSVGTHTVSILVYAQNTANALSDNTLLVQTYIP